MRGICTRHNIACKLQGSSHMYTIASVVAVIVNFILTHPLQPKRDHLMK